MNRFASQIQIVLFTFLFLDGVAQQNYTILKPELKLDGTTLLISYDILNSVSSELFLIGIEVSDYDGNQIIPKTLIGDVGENIKGGDNKLIKWNLAADHVQMDKVLFVEIIGEKIIIEDVISEGKQISLIGSIARSAVFPGWGLSLLNPGKPHWISGVAVYGSVAGSLILNQRAYVNYERYLNSDIESARSTYYDRSLRQEQISVVLACTAAGVWVTEMIWTLVGTKKLLREYGSLQQKGISFGTSYLAEGNAPMLSIKYTF